MPEHKLIRYVIAALAPTATVSADNEYRFH
jgi:hypothetical protein